TDTVYRNAIAFFHVFQHFATTNTKLQRVRSLLNRGHRANLFYDSCKHDHAASFREWICSGFSLAAILRSAPFLEATDLSAKPDLLKMKYARRLLSAKWVRTLSRKYSMTNRDVEVVW